MSGQIVPQSCASSRIVTKAVRKSLDFLTAFSLFRSISRPSAPGSPACFCRRSRWARQTYAPRLIPLALSSEWAEPYPPPAFINALARSRVDAGRASLRSLAYSRWRFPLAKAGPNPYPSPASVGVSPPGQRRAGRSVVSRFFRSAFFVRAGAGQPPAPAHLFRRFLAAGRSSPYFPGPLRRQCPPTGRRQVSSTRWPASWRRCARAGRWPASWPFRRSGGPPPARRCRAS